jgi:hypothetical protein
MIVRAEHLTALCNNCIKFSYLLKTHYGSPSLLDKELLRAWVSGIHAMTSFAYYPCSYA